MIKIRDFFMATLLVLIPILALMTSWSSLETNNIAENILEVVIESCNNNGGGVK